MVRPSSGAIVGSAATEFLAATSVPLATNTFAAIEVSVGMLETLPAPPVPVRSGSAPGHPTTKSVSQTSDRSAAERYGAIGYIVGLHACCHDIPGNYLKGS